jgi:thioredoxin
MTTKLQLLLAGGVIALAAACSRPPAEAPPRAVAAASTQALGQGLPRLVDLGAGKCVSCKAMTTVLEGLRKDFAGKLRVDFIDVWQDRAAAEPWRIAMIPTQVFLAPDGRELWRHEGFISREEILARWKDLGLALE